MLRLGSQVVHSSKPDLVFRRVLSVMLEFLLRFLRSAWIDCGYRFCVSPRRQWKERNAPCNRLLCARCLCRLRSRRLSIPPRRKCPHCWRQTPQILQDFGSEFVFWLDAGSSNDLSRLAVPFRRPRCCRAGKFVSCVTHVW